MLFPSFFNAQVGAYEIEQSLRFNSADSAYLNRTPASAGNRKTYTISMWVKRAKLGTASRLFGAYSSPSAYFEAQFTSSDTLQWYYWNGSGYSYNRVTSQVFRDPSAWCHFVFVFNSPSATGSQRIRIYFNGQEITTFSSSTDPSQNFDCVWNSTANNVIGDLLYGGSPGSTFDGLMTEVHHVDGTALDPSSFGESDNNGVWRPKRYTGSYGTNGFYLTFDPSATNGIGHDHSGNGNNFSPTGFSTSGTGTDVMSDTPTTNWCTLNPLYKPATSSIAPRNGNLEIVSNSTGYDQVRIGTHGFSSGKWYWEYRMEGSNAYGGAGIIDPTTTAFHDMMRSSTPSIPLTGGFQRNQDGTVSSPGVTNVSSGAISNGDVAMFAVDYDSGKVWVGTSGTWYNSGDPAAGTNPTITIQTLTTAVPFFSPTDSGSQTYYINWGQRAFEYTQPTGFKSLNTANLPAPTIKDGGDHFNTVLWTGDGTTSKTVGNLSFQPDWIWVKDRNAGYRHNVWDSVRGYSNFLQPSFPDAEAAMGTSAGTSFFLGSTSSGFTVGQPTSGTYSGNLSTNENGTTYVAWNWKANGSGSSNTDGSITSTVSANPTAGFSIVSYTGNGGTPTTIGHGLGVTPNFIVIKNRDSTDGWAIYHSSIGATGYLEFTAGSTTTSASTWNNTSPTSTVFTVSTNTRVNGSSTKHVAYCFAEVEGYSKFGSYTGNNSTDGPFVMCGFRPAFILAKVNNSEYNWTMYDSKRSTFNPSTKVLFPNLSNQESGSTDHFDWLSNGFKIRSNNINPSNTAVYFMAFAENPFGGSGVSPATAR